MIEVFVKDGPNAPQIALKVERLMEKWHSKNLVGFVIVLNAKLDRARRIGIENRIIRTNLAVPDPDHEETDLRRKFKINPKADSTIIVYRAFRVRHNFVNILPADFQQVEDAVTKILE